MQASGLFLALAVLVQQRPNLLATVGLVTAGKSDIKLAYKANYLCRSCLGQISFKAD
jgi:hypothetical protein